MDSGGAPLPASPETKTTSRNEHSRGGAEVVEFLRGVHTIDSYATTTLYTEQRLILVDTSSEDTARTILGYLEKLRVKPSDLATIFITHTHPDHVGGLAALKRAAPNAKVAAHRFEAEFIERKKPYPGPPGVQRHPGTPVDVELEDSQLRDGLTVVFAPGHTPGNMSLLDDTRSLLIAGDSLRNEKGVAPMDDAYNIDPRQHRASIKKIAAFEFENAVFGHGAPLKGGASRKVRELAAKL